MVARQAQLKTAYETRLAEARARLDEVASQRALDLKSFAGKLSELSSRQARLEKRGAVVAALAAESEGRRNPSVREGGPAPASPADALARSGPSGPRPQPPRTLARRAPTPPFPAQASRPRPSNRIRSMSKAKPWARSPWSRPRTRPRPPTIPTRRRA
jgi:hypothetical protein